MNSETAREAGAENVIQILTRMAQLWRGPMAGRDPDERAVAEWGELAARAAERVKRPLRLIVESGLLHVRMDLAALTPEERAHLAEVVGEVVLLEPGAPITLHAYGRAGT